MEKHEYNRWIKQIAIIGIIGTILFVSSIIYIELNFENYQLKLAMVLAIATLLILMESMISYRLKP